jgi:hypothetical protein
MTITRTEAAESLAVSLHFLEGLIADGSIPTDVNGEIPRAVFETFKAADKQRRRAIAAELTQEAQETGLGYK